MAYDISASTIITTQQWSALQPQRSGRGFTFDFSTRLAALHNPVKTETIVRPDKPIAPCSHTTRWADSLLYRKSRRFFTPKQQEE